jgi:hypothetical protein
MKSGRIRGLGRVVGGLLFRGSEGRAADEAISERCRKRRSLNADRARNFGGAFNPSPSSETAL